MKVTMDTPKCENMSTGKRRTESLPVASSTSLQTHGEQGNRDQGQSANDVLMNRSKGEENPGQNSERPNEDGDQRLPQPASSSGNSSTKNEPKCSCCLYREIECYGSPPPCSPCASLGWTAEKCQRGRVQKDLSKEKRPKSSSGMDVGDEPRQNRFYRAD